MKVFQTKTKDVKQCGKSLMTVVVISLMALTAAGALAQEPAPILELTIPDTARVVDHDNGIYVVGTSGGDLYVMNEAGEYTVTGLGAGCIYDVRIEHPFIAVAAGNYVIKLSVVDLTTQELWRASRYALSVDLSEDGQYVAYLSRSYRRVGVLNGSNGSVISSCYLPGYSSSIFWLDATADMEYILITCEPCPPGPGGTQSGVELYRFDGSALVRQWGQRLIYRYDVTEVRVSEAKDYVAAATSSGTYMDLLRMTDGAMLWSHNTPGKEQYCVDGDDNLNYVIGANQAWSPPYGWFILKNLGASGYSVLHNGTMSGPINDLDSNPDASLLAFGSDAGEFLLLSRSDDTVETVFHKSGLPLIDAIEIGGATLLVGGSRFINLYGCEALQKKITSGPVSTSAPESITFEILNTCGADPQEFFLNGVSLGTVPSSPAGNCTCEATMQTFTVTDPVLLAAWNTGGDNTIRYVKSGIATAFAWVRARLEAGSESETVCVYDLDGGNCDVMDLCSAGYTFGSVDQTATIGDPFSKIDVVVEVGKSSTTEYDFDITYFNLGGPEVLVVDTVPAEWVVTNVAGNLIEDGFSSGPQPDGNGGTGTVEVFPANRRNPSNSATKIHWRPDPTLASIINVVAETRQSPGRNNVKFAPTSCGELFLNEDGAEAFEVDPETGEPLRDPETGEKLPPILVSNPLCLAAVEDCNGDGVIAPDGSGDEDGDGLSDIEEACVVGTSPCDPDTDGDGVPDGTDPDPLDPEVF
jgi:WD40 repeat protein